MSLVGNFAFGNYDKSAEERGAQSGGTGFLRRASYTDQDPVRAEHEPERRHSLVGSLTGRRQSAASQSQQPSSHAQSDDRTAVPSLIGDSEKAGLEAQESSHGRSDDDEEDLKKAEADGQVTRLARTLTSQTNWSMVPENPLNAEEDSSLDPNSANFRARDWVKSAIKLNEAENKTPGRTAGIAFRNLSAHGFGAATDYQKDVANVWLEAVGLVKKALGMAKPRRIDILQNFEGLVNHGEMLVVLGPPGSGCSTFLKTITGETHGFTVEKDSWINYQGIPADKMHKYFKGEAIYTAEVDVHFPMLTVGDTLTFAAQARCPKHVPGGVKRKVWADHMRNVIMATFGISHTVNTRVGNDFVRPPASQAR